MYLCLFEVILKFFKEGAPHPQLMRFIYLIWVLVDSKQYEAIHLYVLSRRAAHACWMMEIMLVSKSNNLRVSR